MLYAGIVATEDEIRRWSIELYNEQPRDPKTSMDADFKHQMEGMLHSKV